MKEAPPDDVRLKTLQSARWWNPAQSGTLVRARPKHLGGATLYARPARWREVPGIGPDEPPGTPLRGTLLVRRHVGDSVSEDQIDFSIRGYRFHSDVDEAELAIELPQIGTTEGAEEFIYQIEAGYYDGFPIQVLQQVEFRFDDYEEPVVEPPADGYCKRYVKILDYSVEFRARNIGEGGYLTFFTAGLTEHSLPYVDIGVDIETIPVSECADWRAIHQLARYVGFVPNNESDAGAIFEARG